MMICHKARIGMRVSGRLSRSGGFTLLEIAVIAVVLIILAWIVFPVFVRTRQPVYEPSCQRNLKELATVFQMYCSDYDGVLPSSALRHPQVKSWNASESARFCVQRGPIPPRAPLLPSDISWVSMLYSWMMNKDIIWCPSDANKNISQDPNDLVAKHSMVSYVYKPALDRAWFDSLLPVDPKKPEKGMKLMHFRRLRDFVYPADQVVFFEHTGWHWGDNKRGWSDKPPVTLNAAFLDGHVRSVRLKNAANCPSPKYAADLAGKMSLPGEPMWYNYAVNTKIKAKGKRFDPRVYFDSYD